MSAKKNAPKSYEYDKIQIYLNPDDEYQLEGLTLLNKCGRKKAKFIGILAHEFIKASNLDLQDCTMEELQSFISQYKDVPYRIRSGSPFPLAYYERKLTGGMVFSQEASASAEKNNKPVPPEANRREEKDKEMNEEDINELNDMINLFGATVD